MRLWRRTQRMCVALALVITLVLISGLGTLSVPNSPAHDVVLGVAAQNQVASNTTVRNNVSVLSDSVSLGSSLRVEGVVTTQMGPLASVPVVLHVANIAVARTQTDASGKYAFSDPVGLNYVPVVFSNSANVYTVAVPTNTTFPSAPSAVGNVPVNAVPAHVIILVVIGLTILILYINARRGTGGRQRVKSLGAVPRQRSSRWARRRVLPQGDKNSRAHAEVMVTHATRATLATAATARAVFNLAWYELFAIFLILAGEGMLFAGYRVLGVGVQALNIVAIAVIVATLHVERLQLLQALALVSVFRVVNLSFTLIPIHTIYWLATIYAVMYLPIILLIVHEGLSRHDLGIDNMRRSVILVPLGAVIGAAFGVIEYAIIANNALIPNASVSQLIQLSIVMIFFVALVEELLFRVLLQQPLIERTGAIAGILIASVIFGAMHSGYANVYELLFAIAAGLIFGVAFYKTKNLAFVVTIHAVNNIILFGMPAFFTH